MSDPLMRSTVRDVLLGLAALAVFVAAGPFSRAEAATALVLYAAIAAATVAGLPSHRPQGDFGVANRITLTRAVMASAMATGAVGPVSDAGMWLLTAAAALGLALDGVDGWAARRTRTASAFGARFDMEIDALTIMILAAVLWRQDKVGAWVLLAGLLRYAFVAASRLWPWLSAPLPPRERRRAVCAVLVAGLVVACAPILTSAAAAPLVAAGIALTAWSFAVDIAWLFNNAPRPVRA